MYKLVSKFQRSLLAIVGSIALSGTVQAQGTQPPDLSLNDVSWTQIVIPGLTGNRTTVQQYFGSTTLDPANLHPAGDQNWALYEYDPISGSYLELNASSLLKPGVGYWIIQATGSSVSITPPDFAIIAGLPYANCNDGDFANNATPDLCVITYLTGENGTEGNGSPWRMIGNQSADSLQYLDLQQRFFTVNLRAPNFGLFNPAIGSAFQWDAGNEAFIDLKTNSTTAIPVWAGFWFNVGSVPESASNALALLLPTKETKGLFDNQCPAACTTPTNQTPPPPPFNLPASFTETTTDGNGISEITMADVGAQKFFTFTNDRSGTSCQINPMTFNGDTDPATAIKGDIAEFSQDLTSAQYIACVQEVFTSTIPLPLPTEQQPLAQ